MTELQFYLSGELIGTIESDVVPHPGSEVTFKTNYYQKGVWPGSILQFTVEAEHCDFTHFDFTEEQPVVRFDINGFLIVYSAPSGEQ